MTRFSLAARGFGLTLLALCASRPAAAQMPDTVAQGSLVYAIRYGTIPRFPAASLIAGADTGRRVDIAMMVWLIRTGEGRNVLVDAGFHRPDLVTRWRPAYFVDPATAVARAGVKADDVTDVIITHIHWDHLDGLDLFPNARVWIQRDEYDHYIDSTGAARDRTIDRQDAAMLAAMRDAGRVNLIDGDAQEIMPGITVYTGGRHTYASQYVGVHAGRDSIVLASDNVYMYENLEKHVPIAQTLDAASNLAAQDRMRTLVSNPRLIVPGHDPLVFTRFTVLSEDVVRIR